MKIRTNYVSNSSSSSFIIECKNYELAEKVKEAYGKLYDYWMEICPHLQNQYINRENYKIVSIIEIIEHFKNYGMSDLLINEWLDNLKKEQDLGAIFLLGNCCNEDGTIESTIMEMFNENIIYHLQNNDTDDLEIDLIFNKRWS